MEEKQLADKVVHIGRVTKVVKGGRIFKFTALVVVGDYDGNVGIGHVQKLHRSGKPDFNGGLEYIQILHVGNSFFL